MKYGTSIAQIVLSLLTLAATVYAALLAYTEYKDAQQRERVERVFRYGDKITEEFDSSARVSDLGDEFVRAWPSILEIAGPNPAPETINNATTNWFVSEIGGDQELRRAIDKLGLIYDTLAICIAEGLCDERTARALFLQQIAGFASTVYPWVEYRNEEFFAPTGVAAICLRNRFCGGVTDCSGLPEKLADCRPATK